MKKSILITQLLALLGGVYFSLGSTDGYWWSYDNPDWIIENLSQKQTDTSNIMPFGLRVGNRDFRYSDEESINDDVRKRARAGLRKVRLTNLTTAELVPLDFTIDDSSCEISHPPLDLDSLYLLDLDGLQDALVSVRPRVDPIFFRTSSAPTVSGIWKNDDTLLITFSEDISPSSLTLGHESVDIYWEEEGELHSIASDLNLADFVWEAEEKLFMVAPIAATGEVWVKVSGKVEGSSGELLDGNANGIPGEDDDYFVHKVDLESLEICYTRDDIPDTCISGDNLPVNSIEDDTENGW